MSELPNPQGPQLPEPLFPGVGATLLVGPFVVEWDGLPIAVGHSLTAETAQDGKPDTRWHDGDRWHFLEHSFPSTMTMTDTTITYVEHDGRTVKIRPLALEDAHLLYPPVLAETLPGLRTAIRQRYGL